MGKWMSLCCTTGYKWVTVLDGVKFEFNDIILLYTKKTILSIDSLSRIFYIINNNNTVVGKYN